MAALNDDRGWAQDVDSHASREICAAVGEALARAYNDVLKQPLPPSFVAAVRAADAPDNHPTND